MIENEVAAIALSIVDELTNISNRRGFLALAEKNLSYCKRKQLISTLAFLDLNQCKQVNDTHEHATGDNALITFAKLLGHHLRSYDICARLGGGEFMFYL